MKNVTIAFLTALFFASAIFAADGDIDTSFNASAIQFNSQATLYKTRLGANGKIYISGAMSQLNGVSYTKAIARLNADGTSDTVFNQGVGAQRPDQTNFSYGEMTLN